ncbi:MAG TPA: septal ring lytic transglycosylase RlpA family protein [Anaeromyxobacteraceae bacterium]|nr:septal ring lytic transglycosylase RlpA family protein [Anaeromyxobacteraceae bacterium]
MSAPRAAALALLLAGIPAVLLAGDAATPPVEAAAEEGLASYYARRFHGRRTASGERHDMNAMTCAHRTAPFGARLRVRDVATGRSVVVRVNDRGPFLRGRVVDLSWAAAREIGLLGRGLARVRVERVD